MFVLNCAILLDWDVHIFLCIYTFKWPLICNAWQLCSSLFQNDELCCFWSNFMELAATDHCWPIIITVSVLCALEDHRFLQSLLNIIIALPWQFNWDVTKFAFEFDNVRTSNVFSRFEVCRIFSCTRRRIRTSGLHDQHRMSTPTGHRNNELNKCALPNSLKGPKIILDMADHHLAKMVRLEF